MTADPGIACDAQPVVSLSYEEALELAAYGTSSAVYIHANYAAPHGDR
jgi:aspartokinase